MQRDQLDWTIKMYRQRIVCKFFPSISFRIILVNNNKIGRFFRYKDSLPVASRSSVIYQFTCPRCGDQYVGSNRRMLSVKGPIHDSDLQSQPQFPTPISTKFPVYGLQQPQPPPQLAGRCCGYCWSEFSDIWWAIWSSEARSDIVTIRELRFNWERLNRSVAACVGRPSTATAIWVHIAVAIENRCRGWGPLDVRSTRRGVTTGRRLAVEPHSAVRQHCEHACDAPVSIDSLKVIDYDKNSVSLLILESLYIF